MRTFWKTLLVGVALTTTALTGSMLLQGTDARADAICTPGVDCPPAECPVVCPPVDCDPADCVVVNCSPSDCSR